MGSLKDVATTRMVAISETLLDPAQDRPKIEALSTGATLLVKLQAAHDGLLASQRQDQSLSREIAAIQEKQTTLDTTRHDPAIRGIWWVMTGFAELAEDAAEADAILAARDELLPDGISATGRSYKDEAGAVTLAEARMTDATKELLRRLPIPGGTLSAAVDRWFAAGRELGVLDNKKRKLEIGAADVGNLRGEALRARNYWIKVMRHLESTLEMEEVGEDVVEAILGPVRRAERESARKAQRGAGEEAVKGEEASEGEGGEGEKKGGEGKEGEKKEGEAKEKAAPK